MIIAAAACGKTDTPSTPSNPPISPGESAAPPAVSAKDTLNVALTQDRGTLDPSYMLGYDLLNALWMVYEPLWDIAGNGDRIWKLATALDMTDPLAWKVTLREGVKFENGNPFTADDVLFSLYRGNNRTGEPASFPVLNYEKCRKIDDYTVEIAFHSVDIAYPASFSQLPIYDKESFNDETAAVKTNGTGPYVVKDYVINSHLDLTVRDDYWGEKGKIANMHFVILSEDSQRVTALQTGTVDIAGVPYQDIEFVKSLKDVTLVTTSPAMSRAIYFNPSEHSKFYNNADARRAVTMAIDTQAICDIAYSGTATPSKLPVAKDNVDVEDRFLNLGVYGTGQDVESAKALAESSGIAGQSILIVNNGSSDAVVVAELIQADLKKIGVNAEIHNLDPGSWLSIVFDDTQYDIAVDFTTAPSRTIAQNYYSWINYHVGGSYTRNPWPNDKRGLEIANSLMSTVDPKELSEKYMELTEILIEATLWYSLADMSQSAAHNSALAGYEPLRYGNINYALLSWTK
jgi:peptide/nickel transport system substrate-binding protein